MEIAAAKADQVVKMEDSNSNALAVKETITIKIDGIDFMHDISGKNVNFLHEVPDNQMYKISSSKIKLKNIVDYKWEKKHYPGRLIAVHTKGNIIAYAIKVNSASTGKVEGMIRVVNIENGQRCLIKGMTSEALDLEFAFVRDPILLAYIEESILHVQKIEESPDKLSFSEIFKLVDPLQHEPIYDKIAWCPFIPESSNSEKDLYASQLLVWARANTFQCYSISDVTKKYGAGPHKVEDIIEGSMVYREIKSTITDVILSPDGTTLSVATADGLIGFYQIYLKALEGSPRRLHEWKAHEGRTVNNVFFLDDLTVTTNENSLWKNAITTVDNNTEIKIWSCESWKCLQTIKFVSDSTKPLRLRVTLDKTASYLVLNDMDHQDIYVIQIEKLPIRVINEKTTYAVGFKSIAKFSLASPILSLFITDAAVRRYKCGNLSDAFLIEDMDDFDEETNSLFCVVLQMFFVQPKSVQKCNLMYQPEVHPDTTEVHSSIGDSTDEAESKDGDNKSTTSKDDALILPSEQPKPNFSESISENTVSNEVLSTLIMLAKAQQNLQNPPALQPMLSKDEESTEIIKDTTSTGSSPSREVEKILSLNENNCFDLYYDDPEGTQAPGSNHLENDELDDVVADGLVTADDTEALRIELQEILTVKVKTEENNDDEIDETYEEYRKAVDGDVTAHDSFKSLLTTSSKSKDEREPTTNWPKAPTAEVVLPGEIKQLADKIDRLYTVMEKQAYIISELREEVKELRQDKGNALRGSDVKGCVNECFDSYERRHNKALSELFSEREKREIDTRDKSLQKFNVNVNHQLDSLSKILTNQIQSQLITPVLTKLDTILETTSDKNFSKMQQTQVNEFLIKLYRSQGLMDLLSKTLTSQIKPIVDDSFKVAVSQTLIPCYERLLKELFSQIHTVFIQGTNEYTKLMEKHIQQFRLSDEQAVQIINLLRTLPEQIGKISEDTFNNSVQQISTNVSKDLKSTQINLTKILREQIKTELKRSLDEQTSSLETSVLSAVRSQAQTPAPSMFDLHEKIKFLLAANNMNEAFHAALIANDLSLVEYTLAKADIAKVFNPCTLEQTVLLSLIQQLSADMKNYSDIKHKYLSEAIMNLNLKDSVTKAHAPAILKELRQNCQVFLQENPKHALYSHVRMLIIASQGVESM